MFLGSVVPYPLATFLPRLVALRASAGVTSDVPKRLTVRQTHVEARAAVAKGFRPTRLGEGDNNKDIRSETGGYVGMGCTSLVVVVVTRPACEGIA